MNGDKLADIHSCSYYCDRPECMQRQRDELRGWMEKLNWLSGEIVDAETLRLHMGEMSPDEVRIAQAAYRFGRTSASLAAHSAQGVGDGWEYEFEIEQDGEFVAGGTTSTPDAALSEATHYEAMYGQDGGPVIARFWRKQPISRDALAAPTKETP